MNAIVLRLQHVAVLKGLNHQQLQELARHAERKWFSTDEVVVREGQVSEAVYIIESGRACALHSVNESEVREVMQFTKSEVFGEKALTRGQSNPESIVAATDLEVWEISHADLEALLESSPQTALQFANLIDMRADATRRIVGGKN